MNWGGFGAGFSHGFGSGVQMGKTIKEAMKQHQLEQLQAKSVEDAKAARAADVNGMIKENGIGEQPKPAEAKSQAQADSPNFVSIERQQEIKGGAAAPTVETQSVIPATVGLGDPRPISAQGQVAAPEPITPQAQGEATTTPAAPTAPAQITPNASAQITPATPEPAKTEVAPTAAAPVGPAAGMPQREPAQPQPPQMPFMVGSKGFKTREEAAKYADKQVGSMTDYMLNSVVPKRIEFHVANGDIESATKLQDYMDSKRGKDAVKSFGKAMTALMFTGDTDGGIKALGEYYTKYVDDDVDFVSHSIGKDGQISLTMKNKGDGKERQVSMSKSDLLRLGFAHDPAKLVEMGLTAAEAQRKEGAEIAKEQRQEGYKIAGEKRGENRDMRKENRQQDYKMEEKTIDSQLRAAEPGEVGKKARDFKRMGWNQERIDHYFDKDGEFKKTTNPTERRALVVSDLTKNDPMFGRKPKEEQNKQVDQVMSVIYGDSAATPSSTAPANPAADGLQRQSGAKKGVPVFDTKTGKIVYR